MPDGLRDVLYIRDDDYRLSFRYGNFATLTNLKSHDVQRIIEYRDKNGGFKKIEDLMNVKGESEATYNETLSAPGETVAIYTEALTPHTTSNVAGVKRSIPCRASTFVKRR